LTPEFVKAFGKSIQKGNNFVLNVCPMCEGQKTFEFVGTGGLWKCESCTNGDVYDIASLRSRLSETELYAGLTIPEPEKPSGLIEVASYVPPPERNRIPTGFTALDRTLNGLGRGGLTVVTGKTAGGKSTFTGQLALNAIQAGENVCFYSGELSSALFQNWIFSQAAGAQYMKPITTEFGRTDFAVDAEAEKYIRTWLKNRLYLYDNTDTKIISQNDIISKFEEAHRFYGCNYFVIDNLMTAKTAAAGDRDFWRAQANFTNEVKAFTNHHDVITILVAHPKKGNDGESYEDISGASEISNFATNVIGVRKFDDFDKDKMKTDADGTITVTKNREYGEVGKFDIRFDKATRRLAGFNDEVTEYDWIKEW
jgi:replicative DNA helicase